MITIDGVSLLITFPSVGVFTVARDLYGDWKEWMLLGDNMKYPPAFDTAAGDAISATQNIAPYFFLRNDFGWRIAPFEGDGTTTIEGNLFGRDPDLPIIIPTVGAFTSHVTQVVSPQAIEVDSPLSTQQMVDVATAVWDEVL